jgi:hypothetical protein
MPSGAVASILEKDATKNTILFEDLTRAPLVFGMFEHRKKREVINPTGVPCHGSVNML